MIMIDNCTDYHVKCSCCQESYVILARAEDIQAWMDGALIQNVLSYLSIDERELLISRVCGECFDEMFGGDEA